MHLQLPHLLGFQSQMHQIQMAGLLWLWWSALAETSASKCGSEARPVCLETQAMPAHCAHKTPSIKETLSGGQALRPCKGPTKAIMRLRLATFPRLAGASGQRTGEKYDYQQYCLT